jgi:hypothetical protein
MGSKHRKRQITQQRASQGAYSKGVAPQGAGARVRTIFSPYFLTLVTMTKREFTFEELKSRRNELKKHITELRSIINEGRRVLFSFDWEIFIRSVKRGFSHE